MRYLLSLVLQALGVDMARGDAVKMTDVLSECHTVGTPLLCRLLDHLRAFFFFAGLRGLLFFFVVPLSLLRGSLCATRLWPTGLRRYWPSLMASKYPAFFALTKVMPGGPVGNS